MADYQIVGKGHGFLFFIDLDLGGRTVTNDAEAVVRELLAEHPEQHLVYRDTDGYWTELLHVNGQFTGFKPYRGALS